jgi:hypothetical protein
MKGRRLDTLSLSALGAGSTPGTETIAGVPLPDF